MGGPPKCAAGHQPHLGLSGPRWVPRLGQPVDWGEGPGARDDVPLIPADDDAGLTLLITSNFSMNCLASEMSLQHVL